MSESVKLDSYRKWEDVSDWITGPDGWDATHHPSSGVGFETR